MGIYCNCLEVTSSISHLVNCSHFFLFPKYLKNGIDHHTQIFGKVDLMVTGLMVSRHFTDLFLLWYLIPSVCGTSRQAIGI